MFIFLLASNWKQATLKCFVFTDSKKKLPPKATFVFYCFHYRLSLLNHFLQRVTSSDKEVIGEPRAPDVVQPLQSVSAKDGDSVQFRCMIVGNPQPDIVWFHAGKPVKLSAEFRAQHDSSSNICCLDISEAFPEDTGRYTVVARNSFGSATSSADLSVRENEALRGGA